MSEHGDGEFAESVYNGASKGGVEDVGGIVV